MEIKIATFRELSREELYDLLQLRAAVFVVEQDCVYQDIDGKDQKALHVMGYLNSDLIAYARVFKPGDYFKEASIGRVVVAKNNRSGGFGKAIMKAAINACESRLKSDIITLSAQTYLVRFYNDLGFETTGEEYLEDGIPHIKMIRAAT